MNHNLLHGTVDDFVSVMPPEFVEGLGGVEALQESFENEFAKFRSPEFKVSAYELGEVFSRYDLESKFVVIIPTVSSMDYQDKTYQIKSYLIAIKYKENNTWYYIDGAGYQQNKYLLQAFMPDLPEDLKVPKYSVSLIE